MSNNPYRIQQDAPARSIITDATGYLAKERANDAHYQWSSVKVGHDESLRRSRGLKEVDIHMMMAAEQLGIVTSEQLGRAFLNSPRMAAEHSAILRRGRYLTKIELEPTSVIAAVGRRKAGRNVPLVLDWNGYYYLRGHHGYTVRNWNPKTVAQPNLRHIHALGVSEVWSYLVAACRATWERPVPTVAGDSVLYRIALAWQNEQESVITSTTAERTPIVRPDATAILGIRLIPPQYVGGGAVESRSDAWNTKGRWRWNPHLESWRKSLLPVLLPPARTSSDETAGSILVRNLFVEMETGSNSVSDVKAKIARYNRVYKLWRTDARWQARFGANYNRVVVVVRTYEQVEAQAQLWRAHYDCKAPTSVIVTSLQHLGQAYAVGRRGLVESSCWLDVFAPSSARWVTLGNALGIEKLWAAFFTGART